MISRARPPDPAAVPEKDEGGKKRRGKERCKSQGKKKKKERKVFFGLVYGSHKIVEIIE